MNITIWHNPNCATSRKVLDLIRARGHAPVVVDYLVSPPPVSEIKAVLKEAGLKPRDLVRKRGTPYEDLGLDDATVTDAALLKAMHDHPLLIERPVVRSDKGTRLARPAEAVLEIL
jgi:arsenate reductase